MQEQASPPLERRSEAFRALQRLTGIPDHAAVALLRESSVAPASDPVGRGFVAADEPARIPLELLPADLEPLDLPVPGVSIFRVRHHASVVRATSGEPLVPLAGEIRVVDEQTWELDARGGRCLIALKKADDEHWIDLEGNTLRVWQVRETPGAAHLESLPRSAPPEVPDLRPLPLEDWLEGIAVAPWLLRKATELAQSADPLHPPAAAGILLRLWWPPGSEDLRRARLAMARGDLPELHRRIRDWFVGLPSAVPPALESAAHGVLEQMEDRLEALEGEGAMPDPLWEPTASDLVEQRDGVQSVRRLLALGGRGTSLAAALGEFDGRAADHFTLFLGAAERHPPLSGDHLRAMERMEPDLWWGILLP